MVWKAPNWRSESKEQEQDSNTLEAEIETYNGEQERIIVTKGAL